MIMMRAKSVLTNVMRDITKPAAIPNATSKDNDSEALPGEAQEERRSDTTKAAAMRNSGFAVNNLQF